MITNDTTPDSRSASPSSRAHQLGDPTHSNQRRWWRRGLFASGVIAVLVSAVVLIAGGGSDNAGRRLTHTIKRSNLLVTVTEQGTLESAENTEIKCQVRGHNTVLWVIESGAVVEPGDELVRLDAFLIQEQIDERTKYALWSRSAAEHSAAQVASDELAVSEYEQGTYVAELMRLEKELAVAESGLISLRQILSHVEVMADSRYKSKLDLEATKFAFAQKEWAVKLAKTDIEVLKQFGKARQLKELQGNLAAGKATHKANVERAMADESRRDRAVDELQHCVVKAERGGLVIHPSAARWENAPEIAEGTNVHKDQVLLLMPDLTKMQVKVGVHESAVDLMKVGLSARVTLPNRTLEGSVSEVASITAPTGWWTGNEVRYDTIVQLPSEEGLIPGMSAEVEILVTSHENVLTIPVAAVVDTEDGGFCWVKTPKGPQRRPLELGDTNDVFTIVRAGLKEGDEVLLSPIAISQKPTGKKKEEEKKKEKKELLDIEQAQVPTSSKPKNAQ